MGNGGRGARYDRLRLVTQDAATRQVNVRGSLRIQIIEVDPAPLAQIAYTRASRFGLAENVLLDFVAVRVDRLPRGVRAIVIIADLQGYDTAGRSHPRLLGEAVVEKAAELSTNVEIVPSESVGVLLAGDYWAHPDLNRRGGMGDVRGVWSAFGNRFRWVCGVAGNHDQFATVFGNATLARNGEETLRAGDHLTGNSGRGIARTRILEDQRAEFSGGG
jgi:hypothetical protein